MNRWLTTVWLLLCACSAFADVAVPEKADFAWGLELEVTDSRPFYRLSLPLKVYQGIARRDLGDLRVLNGRGDVVPHQLTRLPVKQTGHTPLVKTKIFPLYATRSSDIESILIQAPSQWREDRVSIATREQFTASDEVLHGYILQLDEKTDRAVKKLHLEWRVDSQGFVHRLKVEYSKDLEHWHTYKANAVIADLRYGGERLVKQAISLGDIQARYLRLSPAKDSRMIDLLAASVEFAGVTKEVTPNQLAVQQVRSGDKADEFLFQLPGPLSVVSVDILPFERNTLLRATLYSRADSDQRWHRRGSGLVYKLVVEGELLQQTKLKVNSTQDRYWKLKVDTSGGGFGAAQPVLTVGWVPHALVFAARGEGPFSIVYGSSRVGPVGADALSSGFGAKHLQNLTSDNVQVTRTYELAGPKALAKEIEVDWKNWLLWSVLVLGVGLLGWMAWATLRQLSE